MYSGVIFIFSFHFLKVQKQHHRITDTGPLCEEWNPTDVILCAGRLLANESRNADWQVQCGASSSFLIYISIFLPPFFSSIVLHSADKAV